jgi:hypothetical protein
VGEDVLHKTAEQVASRTSARTNERMMKVSKAIKGEAQNSKKCGLRTIVTPSVEPHYKQIKLRALVGSKWESSPPLGDALKWTITHAK